MLKPAKSNWVKSALFDSAFILFPPFICLLLIFIFPHFFKNDENDNEWIWFFLVVCVDVGHVYSTIYRTYLDKQIVEKNKMLFYLSPILLYVVGVILHSINPLLFWRVMTYFAVFHFIRQQYGFMRLYARGEDNGVFSRVIDTVIIYAATIYPIIYWHLQGKQAFNWFVDNDFLYFNFPAAIPFVQWFYLFLLAIYSGKEIWFLCKNKTINLPKNILIVGTIVSWYMGIVYFKGDLTFTLLNVVCHGIPYYALVWAFGNKQNNTLQKTVLWVNFFFSPRNILFFLGFLFLLSYTEELFWDGFVWKEHGSIFPTSTFLPDVSDKKNLLSLLVPLLALPQILHYFIDGFIWKIKQDKFGWFSVLINKENSD